MRLTILIILLVSILYPQNTQTLDTVVLRDGSTIRGTLIEVVPNKHIKIKTTGGSALTLDMSEVLNINRGLANSPTELRLNNQYGMNHINYQAKINFCKYSWAITAGITLLGSAAIGDESFSTTVIPIVGPFMTISQVENDPNLNYLPGAKNMLLTSGILQASFVSFWIIYKLMDMSYQTNYTVAILPQSEAVSVSFVYKF